MLGDAQKGTNQTGEAADSGDDGRVVVSAWDFGGQAKYASGQQQYLVGGALYLLFVPVHYATVEAVPDFDCHP